MIRPSFDDIFCAMACLFAAVIIVYVVYWVGV